MVIECVWSRENVLRIVDILSTVHNIDVNEFVIGKALQVHHQSIHQLNYFEILVATILSQNTNDKNSIRALNNLKNIVGEITPANISNLDYEIIKKAIRIAGLINRKSNTLKKLAEFLCLNQSFFKDLILLDTESARKKLLELPGVGPKTADVFLLIALRKATFPIDTHINRVLKRLGIAEPREKYEDIRLKIVKYFNNNVDSLIKLHVLLIIHGRKICTARNPKCHSCVLSHFCCKFKQDYLLNSN